MPFKKIRSFIFLTILLGCLAVSLLIFANTFIHRPAVQEYLLKKVSDSLAVDLRAGEIELNLWGGIGILVHDLKADSKHNKSSFASQNVRIIIDALELLRGRIILSSLYLFKPIIEVVLTDDSIPGYNPEDIIPNLISILTFPSEIKSVAIEQGRIIISEKPFYLEDLFIQARRTGPEHLTLTVKSRGSACIEGEKANFEITGVIIPNQGTNGSPTMDIILKTHEVPLDWIPSPDFIQVDAGNLDSILKVEGDAENLISLSGQIFIRPLRFTLFNKTGEKKVSLPEVTIDILSNLQDGKIIIRSSRIKSNDLSLSLEMMIDQLDRQGPSLDLEVQGDFMALETFKTLFPSHLFPQWFEESIFSILKSGDIKLNTLKLKGTVEQITNLGFPGNESALELAFACRDFRIFGNGIDLPFENVSAMVTLKDGDFRIASLNALFGDSKIRNSGFNVEGITGDRPSYSASINGIFNLSELRCLKTMEFLTPEISNQIDSLPEISGEMECTAKIVFDPLHETPERVSGRFRFIDCSVKKDNLPLPLLIDEAEICVSEIKENNLLGKCSWGNSRFMIKGDVEFDPYYPVLSRLEIDAESDMNQLLHLFNPQISSHLNFKNHLSSFFSLTRAEDSWQCKGKIDLEGVTFNSDSALIELRSTKNQINFDTVFIPQKMIELKKVLLTTENSLIEAKGVYGLNAGYAHELNISSPRLSLGDLDICLKRDLTPITGILRGEAKIISPGPDSEYDFHGRIQGEGLTFQPAILNSPVNNSDFQLIISNRQLAVDYWNIKIGESSLSANGQFSNWKPLEGNIEVNSDYLDFTSLLKVLKISDENTQSEKPFTRGMDIGIKLDIQKGIWRKLSYGPMKGEITLGEKTVHIKQTTACLDNGRLSANGYIMKGEKPGIVISSHVRLTDQPIDELMESIGIGYQDLKGNLTMEALLTISGNKKEELIQSLSGGVNVTIKEGLINRSRVFIKILDFLSLQNIFKQRPPDLKKEGFYFESISGDAMLDSGVLRSENAIMRSPVFNAVAYGEWDIPQNSVDFLLATQPHGTIDTLISNIPIVGYIITGEKRSVLTYPFTIKGPLSDPDVKFTPFKSIGEGIVGIIKRLILKPLKIIQDLSKPEETTP